MDGLSSLDEAYRGYSLAHTDDLIGFWRSVVKVTAGHLGGECIHIDAGTPKSILFCRFTKYGPCWKVG